MGDEFISQNPRLDRLDWTDSIGQTRMEVIYIFHDLHIYHN